MVAALVMAGCSPKHPAETIQPTDIADFVLVKKCADGDTLYRLPSGDVVRSTAMSEGHDKWVRVEIPLDDYCPETKER